VNELLQSGLASAASFLKSANVGYILDILILTVLLSSSSLTQLDANAKIIREIFLEE
jgi:hypothetical protein